MLLKEICTTEVVCCDRRATLLEVARLLRGKHTGDVVVVDDPDGERTPVGLLTDRDIVIKALGVGLDPGGTTAGQLMHTPLISAGEDEDAGEALARMRAHGVRRLPVTGRSGRLVGIVTLDDLLRLVVADAHALLDIMVKGQDVERRKLR
jgi:CBS domain-containing protein